MQIALFDGDCRLLWANEALPFGGLEDMMGQPLWSHLTRASAEGLQAAMLRVLVGGEPQEVLVVSERTRGKIRLWPCGVEGARILAAIQEQPAAVAQLTDREAQACALFAEGLTPKDVARRLELSLSTIFNLRARAAGRIGVAVAALVTVP